ncbi:DNA polymerase III subunit beta family protein [Streptomyces telluris]|uniref:MerR family transcriptional regulator n=1 Tax=Streptomyces telluris TaxID=2720021 RepID=A0A9X2LKW4_9ACTN|nr:MerR family transcriptional regulator [Streptomyces telluris]MCQ8771635.1 MerR family transcriptional regulator [Streptomyces telluris]NJP81063.1 MerR family transcriptional regulator [Streptomyces telluris]
MEDIDIDIDTDIHAGTLMSIGAFARRVGLAPSALRFYDDCDVLRPAHVDDATGYRYYAPEQQARAVLVRRLREAGVPLTDASVVLDGTDEEARAVLQEHATRARETAASAQVVIEEILRALPGGTPWSTEARAKVCVGGAELASAVRQVAPAVASGPAGAEFPVLGHILIEIDGQEVRLVATDRYRLAVRTLRAISLEGGPCRVLIAAPEMKDVAAWAMRMPDITIEVDRDGARLRSGAHSRTLPTADETVLPFPDYQLVLDNFPMTRHRVITDRAALRTALAVAECGDAPIILRAGEQQLALTPGDPDPGSDGLTLPAICTGPPLRIAFDPQVLLAAIEAGVGPDVLLEISSPDRPVVVRSADQGSFTTLVMPVHDAAADK